VELIEMIKKMNQTGKITIDCLIPHSFLQVFNNKKTDSLIFSKKRKGFSVAEGMIVLLISSVALGVAAPMITKQINKENFKNAEKDIIIRKIDSAIPQGAVMFFYDRACPNGWKAIEDIDGRYIRLTANSDEIGSTYEASLPNIKGGFPGVGQIYGNIHYKDNYPGSELGTWREGLNGAFYRVNTTNRPDYGVYVQNDGGERDDYFGFDAHLFNPVYGAAEAEINEKISNGQDISDKQIANARDEVRPRTITFIACIKN